MIVAKKDSASRAGRSGEAASLSLISVRRPRQAADTPAKPTDLSVQLQPAAITPEPAPVAAVPSAPPAPPLPEAQVATPTAVDQWARLFARAPEALPPAPLPEMPEASPAAIDQTAPTPSSTPEAPPAVVVSPFGLNDATWDPGTPAAANESMPPPSPPPEAAPETVASPFGLNDSTARPEPLKPPPVEIPTPQPNATLVARAGAAMATAELPKPAPPPVEAPPAYDDLPTREALIDYWDELRGNADRPQIATLDRRRVAVSWSDSLMVSYQSGDPTLPQMTRFGRLTGDVQYTSMVTEWILSCSRKVSRIGSAMETEQNFPADRGNRTYRMLLLPFASAPAGTSDHVLCNLSMVR